MALANNENMAHENLDGIQSIDKILLIFLFHLHTFYRYVKTNYIFEHLSVIFFFFVNFQFISLPPFPHPQKSYKNEQIKFLLSSDKILKAYIFMLNVSILRYIQGETTWNCLKQHCQCYADPHIFTLAFRSF